jgi:dTDP-4-dehydrorhamnose 3,5-epimerase
VHRLLRRRHGAAEAGIRFDDPDVGIEWPQDIELLYSERDRTAPLLSEVVDGLPFSYA